MMSTFGAAVTVPEIEPRGRAHLDTWLGWMDDGGRRFDAEVRGLRDHELLESSALPGWSRAHVIAHVARNADALGNLLTWARTGIETPMYASAEQRDADIEEGATQSAEVLRFDLDDAERRFALAAESLPSTAWWAEVRTRVGRAIPAADVAWMRCREVWVHGVDLDTGASFEDFPDALVETFLAELADTYTGRPDCGAIELVATDTGGTWAIGPRSAEETIVQGAAHVLLGWLLGRDDGERLVSSARTLPEIPRWL